jgi:hypothetical protein
MSRQPKIPMSPAELPRQRIHEVITLPPKPEPFDCIVGYRQFPKGALPSRTPRSMTYLYDGHRATADCYAAIELLAQTLPS